MNCEIGQNDQAILLLTAPLLLGKSDFSVKPLSPSKYHGLERLLREKGKQPADLLDPQVLMGICESWPRLVLEHLRLLLSRGFLLAQAIERWRARAIWVVTIADEKYPARLKMRMRDKAPPVLYGCGAFDSLDEGGLAVVGSRRIDYELIEYTEAVGQLAAESGVGIVSGGARGVDQAAMKGALEIGGRALGVLSNGLEQAALTRDNRDALMDGRLVLICPYDPAVRFLAGYAMQRNKIIYALADAALVVNSDLGRGGTWGGATEQLDKLGYVPVYVRRSGRPCSGLDALTERGAALWPEPKSPEQLHHLLAYDDQSAAKSVETVQYRMIPAINPAESPHSAARVQVTTVASERNNLEKHSTLFPDGTTRQAATAAERLLPVLNREMTREEIPAALQLTNWGHVKTRYLDPCVVAGWVEMTKPGTPRSPYQRFRRTPDGTALAESLHRTRTLI